MRPLVLYGSETGNSSDLADILVDRLRRIELNPILKEFGEASIEDLQDAKYVVVVCSTTGQGALPLNTRPFWHTLLRKSLASDLLQGVRLATFGLGDSSYPRYNWAIRKIHNRLLQLGATQLIDRGEGDEQDSEGIDSTFDQWVRIFIAQMKDELTLTTELPLQELLPPRYGFELLEGSREMPKDCGIQRTGIVKGKVVENTRITSESHFQDVRHMRIECDHRPVYAPGDVLAVFPCNRAAHVETLISCQNWGDIADREVTVSQSWKDRLPSGVVRPLTLRSLLTWHVDLNAIPRRSFFALASRFAESREREKMEQFSSGDAEDLQDLFDYANRPRRSIVETISEFETLKIPLPYVLDLLPILLPRKFSIASPVNSLTVDITVAIVKYKTILKRIRRGLCTNYLDGLVEGDSIPMKIEETNTKLIQGIDRTEAIVCVATGTGIAPIRSLIMSYKGSKPIYLFFGCRFSSKDFLYGTQWSEYPNVTVFPAFSREGGSYVQQQIGYKSEVLKPFLARSLIYVCGSAGKMPIAVREAFVDIVGDEAITRLEKSGFYLQETY